MVGTWGAGQFVDTDDIGRALKSPLVVPNRDTPFAEGVSPPQDTAYRYTLFIPSYNYLLEHSQVTALVRNVGWA